ncbi:MAG TPA: serine/threonine-protein kinase, partial [Gemmataceae bacterium]|nr:serine/threonine-protein kinase [Gemmataceae bacterium]
MNERPPLDPTVDIPPSGDNLDPERAAAFSLDSGPPLPAGDSVLKALSAGLPSVPRILLREPESFGGSPIVRPSSDEMPDKQDAGARLQLHGEIARGGMGAILKGRDADLGRDVAVKVLLETHQDKTEMLQRFVEEAQISGQLQHPGITPVYELGQFADKRPYFTMKLVKGKTLSTLLAARKSAQEELPRYVGIFAQICQTLAYAHARGVIHRDLKPSNVMVGAFGEVQVMDWGLAKVLKEGA